ncbi:response regulator transcription factor [Domibacillus robiginosus]|uniref:response regulator transcription factor n=1 Tax=Domibacillus robiginosus TaxID=1071054 RepID=UPI00067C362D|nr:response regulator [Domibacillus robiginosus]
MMYKVMLADDDYPVLELLSEMIQWEDLGLLLQSTHENGQSAFDYAQKDMPDILVTDIGMPKMNGIELTKQLKEMNPNLPVIILSCHNEFSFAQQALKLRVQDYVLKDTLDPDDLTILLKKVTDHLEKEEEQSEKFEKMKKNLEQNKGTMKEKFIRKTVYQPIFNEQDWYEEAELMGLLLRSQTYLPALCVIHDYQAVKQLFASEDMLYYALQNVLAEATADWHSDIAFFHFEGSDSFLFVPYTDSLKVGGMRQATEKMEHLQAIVKQTLNLSISFVVGRPCESVYFCKEELLSFILNAEQRFYMKQGSIVKNEVSESRTKDDVFTWYEEASVDFRNLILEKEMDRVQFVVKKWSQFLQDKQFPPEMVKDWLLKMLLDIKMKTKALQFLDVRDPDDYLHQQVFTINSMHELELWLIQYLHSLIMLAEEATGQTRRKEILEACRYISRHIEQKISLDEVAASLYLNPSYFSRLFKKEVGETFVEYVIKIKMNRAKELLDETYDSVGKICEKLGYDNQSYFIKLFKNHTGVTPAEYRNHSKQSR